MQIAFDNSYAKLPDEFLARVEPTPVANPRLIALNRDLALELGLDPDAIAEQDARDWFSGNRLPAGAEPIAMAYSGHQFGGFSPTLGDGRAILLGEVLGKDGIRRDIQLKGAGPTPFSRRGDGRSALGPVLREYLVSEAMHALGVPTTRALAAIETGESVYRERPEPGGIMVRVARSHIRVGTFQYFRARNDRDNLRRLLDYAAERLAPETLETDNPALALFETVIERQAELVAQWMGLGFIHGVMNTDNTSISGETLDYGPCAFLDHYQPDKRFSSIDHGGRYAFNNQPIVAHWNLARLADALLPLINDDEPAAVEAAEIALDGYGPRFQFALRRRFGAKIGIAEAVEEDWQRTQGLLELMRRDRVDFTLAFRHLASALDDEGAEPLRALFADRIALDRWLTDWREALASRGIDRAAAQGVMRQANPVFIPRNHRIQEVIDAAYDDDLEPFHRLHAVLEEPYREQPAHAAYENPPRPEEEVQATFCGT